MQTPALPKRRKVETNRWSATCGRRVVLFGIVRVNLEYCQPAVRDAILAEKTPHRADGVPTRRAGPRQRAWFGLKEPQELYGRLAYIDCNGWPAMELFDVVTA